MSVLPLRSWRPGWLLALGLMTAAATGSVASDEPAPVDYLRDVKPILSDKCYQCHGPDGETREGGLRLDTEQGLFEALDSGSVAFVPGDLEASEAWYKVNAPRAERMPPWHSGKSLEDQEREVLRRWIEQGAPFAGHWSFRPPQAAPLPAVQDRDWPRRDLDRFILARLEQEGLTPSPEASRETLLRRVSLDLTGLPPTLEELDSFLADDSPEAFERAVDRLLASPAYGEHMARFWLDLARYGDTHGYHLDNVRSLWRWRDWVIASFNRNQPFDQFTVEQLAGDLLPDPGLDQLIATGFQRCNPTTGEGGLIAEEYLARYAMDRVDTFGTTWLGLTVGCAQCHDHKYDPVTQRDYYRLFAYFHSFDEQASDQNALAPPPNLRAPTPEQAAELAALDAELEDWRQRLEGPMPAADRAQVAWEREWRARLQDRWTLLGDGMAGSLGGATLRRLEDGSYLVGGHNPATDVHEVVVRLDQPAVTALRLEALPHASMARQGVGRAHNANIVLTDVEVWAAPREDPRAEVRVPILRAQADYSQPDYPIQAAVDADPRSGWALDGGQTKPHEAWFLLAEPVGFPGGTELRLVLRYESQFPQHVLGRFRWSVSDHPDLLPAWQGPWQTAGPFAEASGEAAWHKDHLAAAAGSVTWTHHPDWQDGVLHQFQGDFSAVYLRRTIRVPESREVTLFLGSDDALRLWVDGDLVLERDVRRPAALDQDRVSITLGPGEHEILAKVVNHQGGFAFAYRLEEGPVGTLPLSLARVLSTGDAARSEAQARELKLLFRRSHSPEWAALDAQRQEVQARRDALEAQVPLTMIVRQRAEPRPTHLLKRGQYDQPGERLTEGLPAALNAAGREAADRLALARWLVSGDHPLVARVAVNRLWQQLFGTGLVATSGDFGSQGEWPSHPELLDHLAVQFVESGWDRKALLRRLVTSATYRQSSAVRPEVRERDPDGRLLASFPRVRLDAEMVRDAALAVSGLLVERIGGPSVKPYQPAGLWKAVGYTSSNTANFQQDQGEALYRRSLYTFWKRTSPPPNLQMFDAPTRETCVSRRSRTNTPLQALTLMNDVQFVEAARAFATRLLREDGDDATRLERGFRRATSRRPADREREVLAGFLAEQRQAFAAAPDQAAALLTVGDSPVDGALPAAELAAWTTLANLLLNLDEFVTRS